MRAIYCQYKELDKSLCIVGEQAKHLQVVRIRPGEELLLLNGNGQKAIAVVESVSKKQVDILINRIETEERKHHIHLAVANPKKDAFEDILKIAVEMGVKSISPLRSEYSQYDFERSERTDRLLESALIQSNNVFMPVIHQQKTLEQFLEENKLPLYFFNSRPVSSTLSKKMGSDLVVLIGPEGGFSQREVEIISSLPSVSNIHLATPIQRAPTAVASSIGYLLGIFASS